MYADCLLIDRPSAAAPQVTAAQYDTLRRLGVVTEEIDTLTKDSASARIAELLEARTARPVTAPQLKLLKVGVPSLLQHHSCKAVVAAIRIPPGPVRATPTRHAAARTPPQ